MEKWKRERVIKACKEKTATAKEVRKVVSKLLTKTPGEISTTQAKYMKIPRLPGDRRLIDVKAPISQLAGSQTFDVTGFRARRSVAKKIQTQYAGRKAASLPRGPERTAYIIQGRKATGGPSPDPLYEFNTARYLRHRRRRGQRKVKGDKPPGEEVPMTGRYDTDGWSRAVDRGTPWLDHPGRVDFRAFPQPDLSKPGVKAKQTVLDARRRRILSSIGPSIKRDPKDVAYQTNIKLGDFKMPTSIKGQTESIRSVAHDTRLTPKKREEVIQHMVTSTGEPLSPQVVAYARQHSKQLYPQGEKVRKLREKRPEWFRK